MDTHFQITIPLRDPAFDGYIGAEENDELNDAEDALVDALGNSVVFIGHETGKGRRSIHLFGSAVGPAESTARDWTRKYAHLDPELTLNADPSWSLMDRW